LEDRAQEVVKVVGSWWITESVCAYITGREKGFDFETILLERGTVGLEWILVAMLCIKAGIITA